MKNHRNKAIAMKKTSPEVKAPFFKSVLWLAAFFTITVSIGKPVKIKGTLTNAKDGKYVFLYNMLGSEISTLDSAEIKKGSFQFKKELGRGFYKLGMSKENNVMLVLGSENINFEADANKIEPTAKVTGSKEWELQQQFNTFNKDYQNHMQNIQADVNAARAMNGRNPQKAQVMFKEVQARFDSVSGLRKDFYGKLSTQNPESYIGKVTAFYLKTDDLNKHDYFKLKELDDPEMRRGEMWVALMSSYFQKFLLTSRVDNLEFCRSKIKDQEEGSPQQELLYISMIRNLMVIDQESGARLGRDYKNAYPNSEYQKSLVKLLPPLPVGVGDMAPEIVEKSPDGTEYKLSATRGKVVLIDFWASWCGPCRRENPNVVKAYNKYKDKGFTIFSVSLDKDAKRWKGAIEKDGLIWPTHVSDLRGWSAAPAKLYGVSSIPQTFLVDKDGKIIAKNLRGHALERKLAQLLNP